MTEADRFAAFGEIDDSHYEQEIAALELEKRAIEEQSDVIRHLKERLTNVESPQGLQASRDEAISEESDLKKQIAQARRLIDNASRDLSQ